MTNPKPCPSWCEHYNNPKNTTGPISDRHSKSCPNAEAPKVEIVDLMGALKRSLDQHPNARPAPEPKQGSEVDMRDEYATGDGRVWVLKTAYLALCAEVEELKRDAARHEEEEAANCPEDQSCIETIKALRAELAQAREEIAKLREESANAWTMDDVAEAQATERAAREKAEEMLRSMKVSVVATIGGKVEGAPTHEGNYLQRLRQLLKAEARLVETEEAIEAGWKRGNYKGIEAAYRAILAARRDKEGEKR